MKKDVKVKAHTRKTKSGKTVIVRAHTAKHEVSTETEGSGKEFAKRSEETPLPFTTDEYKQWYHWDAAGDPDNEIALKVENALIGIMGKRKYDKYFDRLTEGYSARGHNKALKELYAMPEVTKKATTLERFLAGDKTSAEDMVKERDSKQSKSKKKSEPSTIGDSGLTEKDILRWYTKYAKNGGELLPIGEEKELRDLNKKVMDYIGSNYYDFIGALQTDKKAAAANIASFKGAPKDEPKKNSPLDRAIDGYKRDIERGVNAITSGKSNYFTAVILRYDKTGKAVGDFVKELKGKLPKDVILDVIHYGSTAKIVGVREGAPDIPASIKDLNLRPHKASAAVEKAMKPSDKVTVGDLKKGGTVSIYSAEKGGYVPHTVTEIKKPDDFYGIGVVRIKNKETGNETEFTYSAKDLAYGNSIDSLAVYDEKGRFRDTITAGAKGVGYYRTKGYAVASAVALEKSKSSTSSEAYARRDLIAKKNLPHWAFDPTRDTGVTLVEAIPKHLADGPSTAEWDAADRGLDVYLQRKGFRRGSSEEAKVHERTFYKSFLADWINRNSTKAIPFTKAEKIKVGSPSKEVIDLIRSMSGTSSSSSYGRRLVDEVLSSAKRGSYFPHGLARVAANGTPAELSEYKKGIVNFIKRNVEAKPAESRVRAIDATIRSLKEPSRAEAFADGAAARTKEQRGAVYSSMEYLISELKKLRRKYK